MWQLEDQPTGHWNFEQNIFNKTVRPTCRDALLRIIYLMQERVFPFFSNKAIVAPFFKSTEVTPCLRLVTNHFYGGVCVVLHRLEELHQQPGHHPLVLAQGGAEPSPLLATAVEIARFFKKVYRVLPNS